MRTPIPAPEPPRTYRCSFTLPVPLAVGISQIAKRLSITQSALLAELLAEPIQQLVTLVELMPPPGADATPEQVRRLTGASVALIRDTVRDAQDAASQIDTDPKLL